MAILAEQRLLTTGDAARLLQVSRQGVHKLVRVGQLPHEETVSGQLFFRYGLVMKAVAQRATARIQRRGTMLAAVRVRMLKAAADGEARQLTLDFSARLRLVGSRGKGRKVA
jgi:Helix-turn-helix domain